MSGPYWAPPGKVARTCRRDGWGMCDLCDEWGDMQTDEEDDNYAFCEDCTAWMARERLKDQLRGDPTG